MLAHEDPPRSRADSSLKYGKRSKLYRKSKRTRNVESQRPTRRGKTLPTRNPGPRPQKIAQRDDVHPGCSAGAPQYPQVNDKIRLVIFAFLSHCLFALRSGRTVESVTDNEFLRAIDTKFYSVFCQETNSGSDASARAAADTDGSSGTVDANGSGWQQTGGSSTAAPTGAPGQYSNFKGKRAREPDDDGHDQDPWRKKPPTDHNAREALESILGTLWACPYFWYDQDTYRDCLQHRLTRISDVRTHVKRRHTQDPHCPSCGLSFVGMREPDCERHIRMRACEVVPNPGAAYPGATKDMIDQIYARGDGGNDQTLPARWYAIWRILFPGRDEPAQPFAPISEVAFAATSYLDRFIESSSDAELQHMARELFPDDWDLMNVHIRSALTRFRQFVIAWEQQRDSQRTQTSGNGNRNRHGRPALQLTRSRPGGTPSLISGSSQPTFTNNDNPPTERGNPIGFQRPMAVLINNSSFVSSDASDPHMGPQISQCEHGSGVIHHLPSTQPLSGQQAPNLVSQQPFLDVNPEQLNPLLTLNTNNNSFEQGSPPAWSSDQFS